MFQDEAGFGRINKPKRCWAPKGIRPSVPCHHMREYIYAYGAVEPFTGESFFFVLPWANTMCMNVFLSELSKTFPEDMILLGLDQASWHTTENLIIPDNIQLFFLPACTPEMNPMEQVWKDIRKRGFKNELFATLEKVVDRLCDVIRSFSPHDLFKITGRDWILNIGYGLF
jgi:putative transposase